MLPEIITVVDFETTRARRGESAQPWQVGIAQLRCGVLDASSLWSSYLRVPKESRFLGVMPGRDELERVAVSPKFTEILPELMGRYFFYPLAAHHAGVERNILRRAAPLHDFGHWVDSLELAKEYYPGLPSYALSDLCGVFGLNERLAELCPDLAPHHALYDACACGVLLEFLEKNCRAVSRAFY